MTRRRRFRGRQKGTTLVELVITIVIISVAIAGVVGVFALISGRSADPLNQTRAVALAQLYMDEILARRYAEASATGGEILDVAAADCTSPELGSEAGETRANFDDVDDYHDLSDSPPENGEETVVTGYNGFVVSVSVACAGGDVGLANHDAKRVDITIVDPSGNDYRFSAYRGNF